MGAERCSHHSQSVFNLSCEWVRAAEDAPAGPSVSSSVVTAYTAQGDVIDTRPARTPFMTYPGSMYCFMP